MGIVWLVLIIVFVLAEALTYQLVSIWFAGGALAALISLMCGANLPIQIAVFTAVSVLLLICTRPVVKKMMKTKTEKTNVDSLIGKSAVITQKVDNLHATGQATVNGVAWTVRSNDDTVIGPGEQVTIEKIEGVKLIVKK